MKEGEGERERELERNRARDRTSTHLGDDLADRAAKLFNYLPKLAILLAHLLVRTVRALELTKELLAILSRRRSKRRGMAMIQVA